MRTPICIGLALTLVATTAIIGAPAGVIGGDNGQRAGDPIYMRTEAGPPWGRSANEDRMDDIFGVGGWQEMYYETAVPATVFSPDTPFVFMEGGADQNLALYNFVNANRSLMESWVAAGGNLLLNAAFTPTLILNVGFGVTLSSPDTSNDGNAANAAHPVFNGPQTPVGQTFAGYAFSQAAVGGSVSAILYDDDGDVILGETTSGSGRVLVGGLTLPWFDDNTYWLPQPNVTNLHHNIIVYASSPPTIFADGFESGNTSAWSSTTDQP